MAEKEDEKDLVTEDGTVDLQDSPTDQEPEGGETGDDREDQNDPDADDEEDQDNQNDRKDRKDQDPEVMDKPKDKKPPKKQNKKPVKNPEPGKTEPEKPPLSVKAKKVPLGDGGPKVEIAQDERILGFKEYPDKWVYVVEGPVSVGKRELSK